MPHAYAEELLVELPAFDLFAALGWLTAQALKEIFGGWHAKTPSEVVLIELSHDLHIELKILRLEP